ncbi:MAG: NAD(+)/NADH kinase [Spirochaetota bacterium]
MSSKIINIIRNTKKYSLEIAEHLKKEFDKYGYKTTYEFNPEAELCISVGGDGSFLKSVRDNNFPQIPFIGVNTGTLGFYPELSPKDIGFFIKEYSKDNYSLNKLNLLKGEIHSGNCTNEIFAINDISIKNEICKAIHLSVLIDDNYLQTISGDGVIISTPMGSSAYNYSAGGSLVYPSLNTMQITPIAPLISNAYRCLSSGVIVPPKTKIIIKPEPDYIDSAVLCTDGESCIMNNLQRCDFFISDKTITILSLGTFNYWKVIKEKFL